jgi:hypothetical protein
MRHAIRSLAFAAFCAVGLAQAPVYLAASLDAAQEVPPNASAGTGFGIVRLDPATSTVNIFVAFENLSGAATAAHLHDGAVGVNGPVIIGLASGPTGWTGSGALTAAQVTSLTNGTMYVNVHTATNPGGEIRGQVVLASAEKFVATLTGANEVPPTASTATADCVAFLHKPENRIVYAVTSTGLVNDTAAHSHPGAVGANGGVIVPLSGSNGTYFGASNRLTATQVTALEANGFYANIHTAANPGGEIRGQLTRLLQPFIAVLSALNELPPNASTGIGEAVLEIGAGNVGSIVLNFSGLTSTATAAHIHMGAANNNGPVLFGLTPSSPSQYTGTFTLSAANLTDLQNGNWYVNVHTTVNPGGEIRGQLGPAANFASFGQGCAGSNGVRPVASVEGVPAIGGAFVVNGYGEAPSALAILAIGFNRDTAAAQPLPLPLSLFIAAPGCWLLSDPAVNLLTFSDAFGLSAVNFPMPLNAGLRGINAYGQWFVFDAAANVAGVVTTDAVTIAIQ